MHVGVADRPGLNPFGPLIATLVVVPLVDGWTGFRRTVFRMARVVGVGGLTLTMSVLIPVANAGMAAGLAAVSGEPFHLSPTALTAPSLAGTFLFMILVVALGEEPGWRGFLQSWLNDRMSPMAGTLIMAVIWMAWHTPMFMGDSTSMTLPPHLLGQASICFVLVWLTNRAQGSVVPAMLCHATGNVVNGVLPYTPRMFWLVSGISTLVAAAMIIGTRGRLGYKRTSREPEGSRLVSVERSVS